MARRPHDNLHQRVQVTHERPLHIVIDTEGYLLLITFREHIGVKGEPPELESILHVIELTTQALSPDQDLTTDMLATCPYQDYPLASLIPDEGTVNRLKSGKSNKVLARIVCVHLDPIEYGQIMVCVSPDRATSFGQWPPGRFQPFFASPKVLAGE